MKNIILVGMPCSGKTTISKKLASITGQKLIDTDDLIESNEKSTIKEIFASKGEAYFRKLEKELVDEWLTTNTFADNDAIISVGGGLPIFNGNMEKLKKIGITVFLDVPIGVLIRRMKTSYERAVTAGNNREKIRKLYRQRINTYMKADLRISVSKMDSEVLSHRILSLVKAQNNKIN